MLSVQDAGRRGYQRFGVSPAGAMDRLALAVANLLVGNPAETAALELGPGVARFEAQGDSLLSLVGPDCHLQIEDRPVPTLTSAVAREGQVVTARIGPKGVYACLALAGGIATTPEMGSRSQHQRSAIGGPALVAGMSLPVGDVSGTQPMRMPTSPFTDDGPIRIVPGPQDDYFAPAMIERLCGDGYRVSAQVDRMGLRLDGPALQHRAGYNIVSDGIVEGAIQVPGDGMPIVLLRDRQTTGGYPKIATIISADLGRLSQIPPGAPVRFAAVTLDQAVEAAREYQLAIARLPLEILPCQTSLSTEWLFSHNLIDGFISADRNTAG